MNAPPIPWLAYLSLAASMALVGSYVGLSKVLVLVFPIFLLALLRFGIAAVAMAGWVRRGAAEAPLSRHDRWLLFFESFFGNFLFSICMLFGVSMSSALAAGVIMAGIPAAVAVMSRVFLKEHISGRVTIGIACAVAGIALVSFTKNNSQRSCRLSEASAAPRLTQPAIATAAMPKRSHASRKIGNTSTSTFDKPT